MRCGTVFFIVSLVFVSLAVAQSYSPEEQKIVDETLSRWKNFAEGNYDAVVTGPKDLVGIEASSAGGLWEKATAEEQLNALKNTPYTLRATPYHIQDHVSWVCQRRCLCHLLLVRLHHFQGWTFDRQLPNEGVRGPGEN